MADNQEFSQDNPFAAPSEFSADNPFAAGLDEKPGDEGFNPVARIGDIANSALESVKSAFQGQKDPAFEGVGGFTGEGIGSMQVRASIERAKITGVSDENYGMQIKAILGDRLIKSEQDKFGQEVITYTDDSGLERVEYINAPGADAQDVSRFINSSLPFLAAGGAVGLAVKGAPLAIRALMQGLGQGTTSVVQDVTAGADIDPVKAVAATGGGIVGETLAPAIRGLVDIFRKNRGLINETTGTLTERGVKAVKDSGVDPEDITPELLQNLAAPDVTGASDDLASVIRARQDEFGIRSSAAQRSLDPADLSLEEQARRGLLGQQAKTTATEFDIGQRSDVVSAIASEGEKLGGGLVPPSTIGEAGERLQSGLRAEIATRDEAIGAAFGKVDTDQVFPGGIPKENFDDLATGINSRLGTLKITNDTPSAKQTIDLLDSFSKGEVFEPELGFLRRGKAPNQNFDDVRRSINKSIGLAANPQDQAATTAIKRAYNDWLGDLANDSLQGANPREFANLQAAIGLTAKTKALFKSRGPKDAGGKIMERIAETADSPEGVISTLFQSGFKGGPKNGAVNAAKRMKTALKENQPEAWHAMRQALWLKMTRGKNLFKEGSISRQELDTALGQVHRNITDAFENKKSLMDVMFTPDEQVVMRKFSTATRNAQSINPNPSGTAFEAQRMKKVATDNVIVNLLRRQAASEQLAKNSVRATAFRVLTQRAISIFGARGEGIAGRSMAKMFSPALKKQRTTGGGGIGGAIGVESENQR